MDVETAAPAAVLADAHLSKHTPQQLEALLAFLQRFPADLSTLFLLGDLFDFWVGVNGRFPSHQEQVIQGIRAARARGARVYYVEGNRDYAIAKISGGSLFDDVISREGAFRVGGARLLLTHGDMINRKDWRYRLWRRMSRHFLAPVAMKVLPTGPLINLASKIEYRLRGTNPSGRRGFPRDQCIAYAQRNFNRGFDAVIAGHFHREEVITLDHKDRQKRFYSVPSWKNIQKVLLIDQTGTLTFS